MHIDQVNVYWVQGKGTAPMTLRWAFDSGLGLMELRLKALCNEN